MTYDEVMAMHNLEQKTMGEVLEESDIKDIEIIISLSCRQERKRNKLYAVIELLADRVFKECKHKCKSVDDIIDLAFDVVENVEEEE